MADFYGFNIYSQIAKELDDFQSKRINLAGATAHDDTIRNLSKGNIGYSFNQAETVKLIDLYFNSKYETGDIDSQKQRKLFMNVGKFRTEVASKQIDLDTKDFVFIPEDYADKIGAWLMQTEFKAYAKDSYFGELINECVDAFPRYGSVVLKKVGKRVEFVPLQTLRNDQGAKDLQSASYVTEEFTDMSFGEIQDMKANGWTTEGFSLPYGDTATVYERHGYVPLAYYNYLKDISYDPKTIDQDAVVNCVIICTVDKSPRAKKLLDNGYIFYVNEEKERPYREAHWSKQHGRWMGIGVMEGQFENQIAKNILINLMKRQLAWSAKKLWQSADPNVARNLVVEVEDGDVMQINPNGNITPVDMTSKNNAEFQQSLNEWERNSDQSAFTYEVATGEALPPGTPFRLGVIMANAVNSFYALKREKLAFVLKHAVIDFLIPEFEKEASKGNSVIVMHSDEPGFAVMRDAAVQFATTQAMKASIFSGQLIDPKVITLAVQPVQLAKELFVDRSATFYKGLKYKFDLVITGEEMDIQKKIISLTSYAQMLMQKGDPRAEQVFERIMALVGENTSLYQVPATSTMPGTPTPNAAPAMPTGGGMSPSNSTGLQMPVSMGQ